MAMRIISCLRPGIDVAVLPNDKAIAAYWDFANSTLELDYTQVIFTSWNPEEGLDESILTQIKAQMIASPQDKWTLVPHAITPGIESMAAALAEFGVVVLGETHEWTEEFGSKRILHRHIKTKVTSYAVCREL